MAGMGKCDPTDTQTHTHNNFKSMKRPLVFVESPVSFPQRVQVTDSENIKSYCRDLAVLFPYAIVPLKTFDLNLHWLPAPLTWKDECLHRL